jgi:T-complex protein 1 subunit gamma
VARTAEKSLALEGTEAGPFKAAGQAFEVIPRTLAQNCGANVIRTLTKLRAAHNDSPWCSIGINGETGENQGLRMCVTHGMHVSRSTLICVHNCACCTVTRLTGELADMKALGVWEPAAVKVQTAKTAIEAAGMLLRIDDIVSGIAKRSSAGWCHCLCCLCHC